MLLKSSVLVAAMAAGGLTAPSSKPVLHEQRQSVFTSKYTKGTKVVADAMLPVKIGLKQNNLERGYDHLMNIKRTGKNWTAKQVHDEFAPSAKTTETVKNWLVASGISSDRIIDHENKGWLSISMSVPEAEQLFGTKYYEYTGGKDGRPRVGNDGYYLPEHIAEHVDYVTPGVQLSPPLNKVVAERAHSGARHKTPAAQVMASDTCGKNITPACIRSLYNVPSATKNDTANAVGVYETNSDIYAQGDLNQFFAKYATNIPSGTGPKVNGVDGATAPTSQSKAGLESDIDMELLFSLVYPQKVVLYQVAVENLSNDSDDNQFTANWLDALDGSFCTSASRSNGLQCGTYTPQNVMSVSWTDDEDDVTQSFQYRACNEFMKLGMQGKTFIFASADYGVGQADGCLGSNGNIFRPNFPNNCPYILSVGATQLNSTQTSAGPESAMNQPSVAQYFSSGGGFSNYFSQPSYQSSAVSSYFANHDPGYKYYNSQNSSSNIGANGGVYNRNGRAYPDVSANGAFLGTFYRGSETQTFGTSLATPIWASLITLINEDRYAAGKGPVGFINPVLYNNTQIFNDITIGAGNANCNSNGFVPVTGFDPNTGLGTPNYNTLRSVLLALP